MKTLPVCLVILSAVPCLLAARSSANYPGSQNYPSPQKVKSIDTSKLYISGGVQFLDMTELNAAISAAGLPALPYDYPTIGFSYQLAQNRVCTEFECQWLIKLSADEAPYQSSYWGFYTAYHVGYLVVNTSHFNLFPDFGIGYGKQNAALVEYSSQTLSGFIAGSPLNLRLESSSFLLFLGIGMDFMFGKDTSSDAVNFALGLRTGYCYQAGSAQWSANDVDLAQSPDNRMSGFYLKLFVGISTGVSD